MSAVACQILQRWGAALAAVAAFPWIAGCRPTISPAQASARAEVSPLFSEVARARGLDFLWTIPGSRPLDSRQAAGTGCAFLDYDNDGYLDVLLVATKPALFRNTGNGQFRPASAETGIGALRGEYLGCAVGDIDNDGFQDIYLSGYRTATLLHNEGGKRFRDISRQARIQPQPWGSSCTFGDVDADGDLDLFVGNYIRWGTGAEPRLCRYEGVMTGCGPREYRPERGVLLRNDGGRFVDVTNRWTGGRTEGKVLGAVFMDYNESGRQSLFLANDYVPADLLQNTGSSFRNVAVESGAAVDSTGQEFGGMGVDWGDYDNDERPDLVIGTFEDQPRCLFRNEGGAFSEISRKVGLTYDETYVTWGARWLDVDNDGWLDLVFSNGHTNDNIREIRPHASFRQRTLLFRNQGGRAFEDLSARLGGRGSDPIVGRGLATGDFDNDGGVDVLVVDNEGAPLLLHNEAPRGHWLSLRLVGTRSNRDGIGAIVTITAGGSTQLRHCHTDGSYLSASDRRVHVGLGEAERADVSIRWPSGSSTHLKGVPADRILTVVEGRSSG